MAHHHKLILLADSDTKTPSRVAQRRLFTPNQISSFVIFDLRYGSTCQERSNPEKSHLGRWLVERRDG